MQSFKHNKFGEYVVEDNHDDLNDNLWYGISYEKDIDEKIHQESVDRTGENPSSEKESALLENVRAFRFEYPNPVGDVCKQYWEKPCYDVWNQIVDAQYAFKEEIWNEIYKECKSSKNNV